MSLLFHIIFALLTTFSLFEAHPDAWFNDTNTDTIYKMVCTLKPYERAKKACVEEGGEILANDEGRVDKEIFTLLQNGVKICYTSRDRNSPPANKALAWIRGAVVGDDSSDDRSAINENEHYELPYVKYVKFYGSKRKAPKRLRADTALDLKQVHPFICQFDKNKFQTTTEAE